jgi:uncharacterized protein (DUF2336 family)
MRAQLKSALTLAADGTEFKRCWAALCTQTKLPHRVLQQGARSYRYHLSAVPDIFTKEANVRDLLALLDFYNIWRHFNNPR